jgi:predicted GNAT family acetyltransferase
MADKELPDIIPLGTASPVADEFETIFDNDSGATVTRRRASRSGGAAENTTQIVGKLDAIGQGVARDWYGETKADLAGEFAKTFFTKQEFDKLAPLSAEEEFELASLKKTPQRVSYPSGPYMPPHTQSTLSFQRQVELERRKNAPAFSAQMQKELLRIASELKLVNEALARNQGVTEGAAQFNNAKDWWEKTKIALSNPLDVAATKGSESAYTGAKISGAAAGTALAAGLSGGGTLAAQAAALATAGAMTANEGYDQTLLEELVKMDPLIADDPEGFLAAYKANPKDYRKAYEDARTKAAISGVAEGGAEALTAGLFKFVPGGKTLIGKAANELGGELTEEFSSLLAGKAARGEGLPTAAEVVDTFVSTAAGTGMQTAVTSAGGKIADKTGLSQAASNTLTRVGSAIERAMMPQMNVDQGTLTPMAPRPFSLMPQAGAPQMAVDLNTLTPIGAPAQQAQDQAPVTPQLRVNTSSLTPVGQASQAGSLPDVIPLSGPTQQPAQPAAQAATQASTLPDVIPLPGPTAQTAQAPAPQTAQAPAQTAQQPAQGPSSLFTPPAPQATQAQAGTNPAVQQSPNAAPSVQQTQTTQPQVTQGQQQARTNPLAPVQTQTQQAGQTQQQGTNVLPSPGGGDGQGLQTQGVQTQGSQIPFTQQGQQAGRTQPQQAGGVASAFNPQGQQTQGQQTQGRRQIPFAPVRGVTPLNENERTQVADMKFAGEQMLRDSDAISFPDAETEGVAASKRDKKGDKPAKERLAGGFESGAALYITARQFEGATREQAWNEVLEKFKDNKTVLNQAIKTKDAIFRTADSLDGLPVSKAFEKGSKLASTRFPTAVSATEDAGAYNLQSDIATVYSNPTKMRDFAASLKKIAGFKFDPSMDDRQIIDAFMKHVEGNLLHMFDSVPPEIRGRSKLWYVGANLIAKRLSEEHDISHEAAAGVLAVLSPQMDWYKNVSLAERALDIILNKSGHAVDQKMVDVMKNREAIAKIALKFIETSRGVKKDDLTKYPEDDDKSRKANIIRKKARDAVDELGLAGQKIGDIKDKRLQAIALRAYDEAYNGRSYDVITPEGGKDGPFTSLDGEDSEVGWGSFGTIEKCFAIVADQSMENISLQLGEEHKVRNFYNNIIDPDAMDGQVTIDTHAVAAALVEPLSGEDPEVKANLGGGGGTAMTGLSGLYPIYAHAYGQAAKARGVLPREMQSITWEAVRGLFTAKYKNEKSNIAAIKSIWSSYKSGQIDLAEARSRIESTVVEHRVNAIEGLVKSREIDRAEADRRIALVREHGAYGRPTWHRSDGQGAKGSRAGTDQGKLDRAQLGGTGTQSDQGTTGRGSQGSNPRSERDDASWSELERKAAELDRRRAARAQAQASNTDPATRRRGNEQIVQKMVNELRRGGRLSFEEVTAALRIIENLMEKGYLDNLSVSVSDANKGGPARGEYEQATELVRLFVRNTNRPGVLRYTFAHEVAHHLERMIPAKDLEAARQQFLRDRAKWLKDKEGLRALLGDGNWLDKKYSEAEIKRFLASNNLNPALLNKYFIRDTSDPKRIIWRIKNTDETYRLTNFSEYFADKVADIATARDDARVNSQNLLPVFAKLKELLAQIKKSLMDIFGKDKVEAIWDKFQEGTYTSDFKREKLVGYEKTGNQNPVMDDPRTADYKKPRFGPADADRQTRVDNIDKLEPNKPIPRTRSARDDGENTPIPGGYREAFFKAKQGAGAPEPKQIKWWTDVGHDVEADKSKQFLWAVDRQGQLQVTSVQELEDKGIGVSQFEADDMDLSGYERMPTHLDWEEQGGLSGLLSGPAHGRIDATGDVVRISLLQKNQSSPAIKAETREYLKGKLAEYMGESQDDMAGYDFTDAGPFTGPEVFSARDEEGADVPKPSRPGSYRAFDEMVTSREIAKPEGMPYPYHLKRFTVLSPTSKTARANLEGYHLVQQGSDLGPPGRDDRREFRAVSKDVDPVSGKPTTYRILFQYAQSGSRGSKGSVFVTITDDVFDNVPDSVKIGLISELFERTRQAGLKDITIDKKYAGEMSPEDVGLWGHVAKNEPEISFQGDLNTYDIDKNTAYSARDEEPAQAPMSVEQRKARIEEIKRQIMPLAQKGALSREDGALYSKLGMELETHRFEMRAGRGLKLELVKPMQERGSAIPSEIVKIASDELASNRAAFEALTEASLGVGMNKDTAVDVIMNGKNPDVSPADLYSAFDRTREALRKQFGDTIVLYRAHGKQKQKATQNWHSTEAGAREYGNDIERRVVAVDDIVAVNVGLRGAYEEFVVGKNPASADITDGAEFTTPGGELTNHGDKDLANGGFLTKQAMRIPKGERSRYSFAFEQDSRSGGHVAQIKYDGNVVAELDMSSEVYEEGKGLIKLDMVDVTPSFQGRGLSTIMQAEVAELGKRADTPVDTLVATVLDPKVRPLKSMQRILGKDNVEILESTTETTDETDQFGYEGNEDDISDMSLDPDFFKDGNRLRNRVEVQGNVPQYTPEQRQMIKDINAAKASGDMAKVKKLKAQFDKSVKDNDTQILSARDEDGDYRGSHRAPDGANGEGSMDAMDRTYPEDIYGPKGAQYYGARRPDDVKIHKLIQSVRGNPDAKVTVYRAVPKGVGAEITPGNWVTPSREYAAEHGERFANGYEILERQVRAGDLFTEGNSLQEFGWNPTGEPIQSARDEDGENTVIPGGKREQFLKKKPAYKPPYYTEIGHDPANAENSYLFMVDADGVMYVKRVSDLRKQVEDNFPLGDRGVHEVPGKTYGMDINFLTHNDWEDVDDQLEYGTIRQGTRDAIAFGRIEVKDGKPYIAVGGQGDNGSEIAMNEGRKEFRAIIKDAAKAVIDAGEITGVTQKSTGLDYSFVDGGDNGAPAVFSARDEDTTDIPSTGSGRKAGLAAGALALAPTTLEAATGAAKTGAMIAGVAAGDLIAVATGIAFTSSDRLLKGLNPIAANMHLLANDTKSPTMKRIAEMFNRLGGNTSAGAQETYHDERDANRRIYRNKLAAAFEPLAKLSQAQIRALDITIARALAGEIPMPTGPVGEVVRNLQDLSDELYRYLREAGVEVNYAKDYAIPHSFNAELIAKDEQAFIDAAEQAYIDNNPKRIQRLQAYIQQIDREAAQNGGFTQDMTDRKNALNEEINKLQVANPRQQAEDLAAAIMAGEEGGDQSQGLILASNPSNQNRADFLKDRVFEQSARAMLREYFQNDPRHAWNNYIARATTLAEFARRFGSKGETWMKLVEQMRKEGVKEKDITQIKEHVLDAMGALTPAAQGSHALANALVGLSNMSKLKSTFLTNFLEAQAQAVPGDLLDAAFAPVVMLKEFAAVLAELTPRQRALLKQYLRVDINTQTGNMELARIVGLMDAAGVHNIMENSAFALENKADFREDSKTDRAARAVSTATSAMAQAYGIEASENAKRAMGARYAAGRLDQHVSEFLRDNILARALKKVGYTGDAMTTRNEAIMRLRRAGINDSNMSAFSTWWEAARNSNNFNERLADTTDPMAAIARKAIRMESARAMVNSNRAMKPGGVRNKAISQDNFFGKIVMSFLNYPAAFREQVGKPMARDIATGVRGYESEGGQSTFFSPAERARMVARVAAIPAMAVSAAVFLALRVLALGDDEDKEELAEKTMLSHMIDGVSYTGFTGGKTEAVQRFRRGQLPPIIDEGTRLAKNLDRESTNSNGKERAVTKSLTRSVGVPATQAVVSTYAPVPIAAAVNQALASKTFNETVVNVVAGPEQKKGTGSGSTRSSGRESNRSGGRSDGR